MSIELNVEPLECREETFRMRLSQHEVFGGDDAAEAVPEVGGPQGSSISALCAPDAIASGYRCDAARTKSAAPGKRGYGF